MLYGCDRIYYNMYLDNVISYTGTGLLLHIIINRPYVMTDLEQKAKIGVWTKTNKRMKKRVIKKCN